MDEFKKDLKTLVEQAVDEGTEKAELATALRAAAAELDDDGQDQPAAEASDKE